MLKTKVFRTLPLPFEVTAALQILGHRIALARKERGHSQLEFAGMLGVGRQLVVFMERGEPTVQIGHYARALWLLEMPNSVLGNFGLPSFEAPTA